MSSKIPDSVLYSKSLIPNRALLLLMNCLNPSRPLNSNSNSSTHKLQSGLYTTLHCLRLRTILVNCLIFHNLSRWRSDTSIAVLSEITTTTDSDLVPLQSEIYPCEDGIRRPVHVQSGFVYHPHQHGQPDTRNLAFSMPL